MMCTETKELGKTDNCRAIRKGLKWPLKSEFSLFPDSQTWPAGPSSI